VIRSELSPGFVVDEAEESDTEEVVVYSPAEQAAFEAGYQAGFASAKAKIDSLLNDRYQLQEALDYHTSSSEERSHAAWIVD
jgi:hypothetical protein